VEVDNFWNKFPIFLVKMGPLGGSRQKLRNCVYICKSYAEKTVASFFWTRCSDIF